VPHSSGIPQDLAQHMKQPSIRWIVTITSDSMPGSDQSTPELIVRSLKILDS
jgi:hypothetical protein